MVRVRVISSPTLTQNNANPKANPNQIIEYFDFEGRHRQLVRWGCVKKTLFALLFFSYELSSCGTRTSVDRGFAGANENSRDNILTTLRIRIFQ